MANDYNQITKSKYGLILYNKHDDWVGKSLEAYGEYSEGEVDIFKNLIQEGDIVVEAGSNIGAHTLPLSRIVGEKGRVYSFEPQRLAFQTICGNMAMNSIMNVVCFQAGVSNKNEQIKIKELNYNQDYNFGGFSIDNFKGGNTTLDLYKLDDKLAQIPRLKLIKMDIEGMEAKALKGAKQLIEKFKPILYLENDKLERSKKLLKLLFSMNYRVFWHFPPMFNPNNFKGNKECVFYSSAVISSNIVCFHKSTNININLTEAIDPKEHPLKKILENAKELEKEIIKKKKL